MPTVQLTQMQVETCIAEAQIRTNNHALHSKQDKWYCSPEQRIIYDQIGVCAEFAVAIYLGLEWTGQAKHTEFGDVSGYEVRAQERQDGRSYELTIRKNDLGNIYIFCVVDLNQFQVVIAGWDTAENVRENGWLKYPDSEGYVIKRRFLNKMSRLKALKL